MFISKSIKVLAFTFFGSILITSCSNNVGEVNQDVRDNLRSSNQIALSTENFRGLWRGEIPDRSPFWLLIDNNTAFLDFALGACKANLALSDKTANEIIFKVANESPEGCIEDSNDVAVAIAKETHFKIRYRWFYPATGNVGGSTTAQFTTSEDIQRLLDHKQNLLKSAQRNYDQYRSCSGISSITCTGARTFWGLQSSKYEKEILYINSYAHELVKRQLDKNINF